MTDFSNATLKAVAVHFVGNKGTGQELVTANKLLQVGEADGRVLVQSFMGRFSDGLDKYKFHHPSSLEYNEMYRYSLEVFAEESQLLPHSVNMARHLYESSTHPKIKSGELYVCLFGNCLVNDIYTDAIGLYKTETKSHFLDLSMTGNNFDLVMREGVEVSKFDKGCLVLPTNAEEGFDVFIFDNNARGEEAVYWRETFLNIIPQANEYFQTNQVMSLTRQFVTKQVPEEFDLSKTDQIDLVNKSVDYFRANGEYNKKQFEKEVLQDAQLIKSFRQFENNYAETHDIELSDSFALSGQAVKKQSRVFKSVLKLDRNFHIYIHGDKDLIEKGYDERVGKSFYKIYFDEEE
jgi:hypothetical protein